MANVHSPVCTINNNENENTNITQGTNNLNNSGSPPLNQAFTNNLAYDAIHETGKPTQVPIARHSHLVINTALNNNKTSKKNNKLKNPLILPLKEVLASQLQPRCK